MSATLRPDLATVQPLYYVAVEQDRFLNVAALCRRLRVPWADIKKAVDLAHINCSTHVVLDRLVLGQPEDKRCAVLFLEPGGAVLLCTGVFGHMTSDEAEIRAAAALLSKHPEYRAKAVFVFEFRPNVKRVLQ